MHAVAAACSRLEVLVPSGFEASPEIGRGLITIKRDLFNHRALRRERNRAAVDWLGSSDRQLIDTAYQAIEDSEATRTQYERAHEEERLRTRIAALNGTADGRLGAGLAVINPALYDVLEAARADRTGLTDKEFNQLTSTAMRYLLRASRKTSPIATFGPVWTAGWEGEYTVGQGIGAPELISCTRKVRSALLQRLMQHLLIDWENLAGDAPVALNRSLSFSEEGAWDWWKRRFDEAPNAILSGAQLERVSGRSGAISAIARVFGSHGHGFMTVAELRQVLGTAGGEHVSDRMEKALRSAWQSQLLVPMLHDHQDGLAWARAATKLLAPHLASAIGPRIEALCELSVDEDLPTRVLVREYQEEFAGLHEAAGIQGSEAVRSILTVDARAGGLGDRHPRLPGSLIATLTSLCRAMPALAADTPSAQMLAGMRRLFDDRNPRGSEGKEPLSSFVQAYFDAGGETQSEILQRAMGMPGATGEFDPDPINRGGARFLDDLAAEARSCEEIRLSSGELESFSDKTSGHDFDYVSLQFHIQSIGGGKTFVLNQIFPGACSTLTRFLPRKKAPEQSDYLRRTLGPRIPFEINAAFGFNASAHPDLVDLALSIPPIPDCSERELIDIKSLWVERGSRPDELRVRGPEGQEYAPIFVAALNPMSLPKQYQALHALCVNHWRHSGLSTSIIRRAMEGFDGFCALARVSIDDVIVLRRTWLVSVEELPDVEIGSADFFRAFNTWADQKGLPVHLFYQANAFPMPGDERPLDRPHNRKKPRLYKPMPLDRNCALGVELFQQAARKSTLGLLLCEALPSPTDGSYTCGGEPVAAELAVEITCHRLIDD